MRGFRSASSSGAGPRDLPASPVAASTIFSVRDLASSSAAVVIAGCHSLIAIDGSEELLGDPIETAALAGVKWSYDHATQRATPGQVKATEARIAQIEAQLRGMRARTRAAHAASARGSRIRACA